MVDNTNLSEKGWIYHRQREQPAPDQKQPPLSHIKFYLDRYRIKEALQVFFEDNTLDLLRVESDFMWDLIPVICQRLRGLCQYRFRVFEGCERMLCRIAVDGNCNPKEVLISLLSELNHPDDCDDDNVFRAMIRPIEGTLLRMNYPAPREENFKWVLNTLMRHVNSIELPSQFNHQLTIDATDKRRPSQVDDPNMRRFIEVLPLMLNFIEEFNDACLKANDRLPQSMPILTESQISEVLNGSGSGLGVDDDFLSDFSTNRGVIHDASVNALITMIYKPLAYLDLTSHCQEARFISKRCLTTLLRLRPDLFSPIYKQSSSACMNFKTLKCFSEENLDETGKEAIISMATCSYLYRCERTSPTQDMQFFPQVITREYLLYWHVPYVIGLLECTEEFVHEKGLLLLQELVSELSPNSLGNKFYDLIQSSTLDQQLFKVMVYSPLWTNRRKAYDIFSYICDLLTEDCKVKLFKHALYQIDLRPCIRAACIDQYRKCLANMNRDLLACKTRLTALELLETGQAAPDCETTAPTTTTTIISQEQSSNPTAEQEKEAVKGQLARLEQRYRAMGGSALVGFLDLCVDSCLPDCQHTDIVENFELLLATLTMFRFLKLRKYAYHNPEEDSYLGDVNRLERELFSPVRNAIAMLASELKSHHKELVEGHNKKGSSSGRQEDVGQASESDLVHKLLASSRNDIHSMESRGKMNDEVDCLNWALCRLDLVESILARTKELYE